MAVSYGAKSYIKGAIYDAGGHWIVGVGVETATGYVSTIHCTVIPVYKGQYFSCNEITSTANGDEYVSFIKNYV